MRSSAATIARGLGRPGAIRWTLQRADQLFSLRYGRALVGATRRPGAVPVFGTNGQAGWHDTPLFDGPGVILGRKGMGHLGVEWTDRAFWVIDTAYALKPADTIDLKFAYYLIRYVGLDHLKHGTSNPSLTREAFGTQYFPVPPLPDQRRIAPTLGALDDKIESNRRAIDLELELAIAQLSVGGSCVRVGDVAALAKGLSYKGSGLDDGADPGSVLMFNLGNFTTSGQLKADGMKFYTGDFKPAHHFSEGELLIANTDLTRARELLGRGFLVPPALAGAIHTHHTSVVRFFDRPWLVVCLWRSSKPPTFANVRRDLRLGRP